LFGDLDARGTAAASIAQALPGNLAKLNRAKRDSERRKTPSFKAAQKMWHSKNTAANPGRKSSVAYKAAQKNIGQLLKLRQLQQDDNLLLRIKQQRKSGIQSVGQLLKPRQPSQSLTAIAASPSVTLLCLLYEICDCSVAARRAGAGIEMKPRQPSKSLTAIAASPSVTLLGILYEICDCSVAARRASRC
jgi:hypothetical protein